MKNLRSQTHHTGPPRGEVTSLFMLRSIGSSKRISNRFANDAWSPKKKSLSCTRDVIKSLSPKLTAVPTLTEFGYSLSYKIAIRVDDPIFSTFRTNPVTSRIRTKNTSPLSVQIVISLIRCRSRNKTSMPSGYGQIRFSTGVQYEVLPVDGRSDQNSRKATQRAST